jgi:hypothetical protein
MEYVLLGALLVGVILVLAGWLAVVIKGFQRHAVTGVVALIPVLNVVTLPSLWHRVSAWVIIGFVGLLIAVGAWLGGAQTQLQQHTQHLLSTDAEPAPTQAAEVPVTPAPTQTPVAPATPATPTLTVSIPLQSAALTPTPVPEAEVAQTPQTPEAASITATQALPTKALYHMVFETLPLNKLGDHLGAYLRIIQKDGKRREGKLQNVTNTEITLEEREAGEMKTQTLKLSDLREVSVMRNQQDKE